MKMLLRSIVTLACASGTALTLLMPAAFADFPVEDHYFTTSDGLKLHYARLGESGSRVILIHGSGGMGLDVVDLMNHLDVERAHIHGFSIRSVRNGAG